MSCITLAVARLMVKVYLCKTPILWLRYKLFDTPPQIANNQWLHISKKSIFLKKLSMFPLPQS